MTKHPLTDQIIEKIAEGVFYKCDMRVAADWQLEQCIAWLNDTDCDDPQETAQRLREAMRPQENN